MPGNYQNPTTMWTPNGGWQDQPVMSQNYKPQSNPWQISNSDTSPGAPSTINDPTATGTPQTASWTGSNGLQTTGVMNPFGLTQNDASRGYWGANIPQVPTLTTPTNNFQSVPQGMSVNPDGTYVPTPGMQPQQPTNNFQDVPPGMSVMPDGTFVPTPSNTSPTSGSIGNRRTGYGTYDTSQSGSGATNTGFLPPNSSSMFPYNTGGENQTNINQGIATPNSNQIYPQWQQQRNTPITINGVTQYPNTVQNWANGGGVSTGNGLTGDPNNPNSNAQSLTPQTSGVQNTQNTTNFTPNYLQNVTSGSLDQNGNQQYSPTNPTQFADPATANWVAQAIGGKASGTNISGPGMGFSQPMQMINGGMNAGLAANTLSKYGTSPGSYGMYKLAQDQAQMAGQGNFPSYDAWASQQPGYNPGTRNTSSYDTAGNNAAFQQNPQQFAQNNPNSGLAQPQNQQADLYHNIYSQLAPILSLLQLLGLTGGNFGGSASQGQQQTYQPQPLNLGSLSGFPFYSRYA